MRIGLFTPSPLALHPLSADERDPAPRRGGRGIVRREHAVLELQDDRAASRARALVWIVAIEARILGQVGERSAGRYHRSRGLIRGNGSRSRRGTRNAQRVRAPPSD